MSTTEPVPLKEALTNWVNERAPEHLKESLMAQTKTETPTETKNPAKKVHLLVTVGADDERTMDEFQDDLKEYTGKTAKNVTVLTSSYLVDGVEVNRWEYEKQHAPDETESGDE